MRKSLSVPHYEGLVLEHSKQHGSGSDRMFSSFPHIDHVYKKFKTIEYV